MDPELQDLAETLMQRLHGRMKSLGAG